MGNLWDWLARRFFAAVLMSGIGGLMLYFGLPYVREADASRNWAVTEGTVTSAAMVRTSSNGGTDRRDSSRSAPTYRAEIVYEFKVDALTLHGNRIAFMDYASSDMSHAQGLLARYPVGMKVAVHTKPGDPSKCVLEPGANWRVWLIPGIGAVLLLVSPVPLFQRNRTRASAFE